MKKLLVLLILSSFAFFNGCKDDDETTIVAPGPDYNVTGTITGKVRDNCTGKPIAGVIVSVGVNGTVFAVTSDASGSFSFANVPAGEYEATDGSHIYSGEYTMTYSFVNVNGTIADTAQRYRDYYYEDAVISFTNPDSSRFIGLVAEVFCEASKMGTSITGVVVDVDEQPVTGAIVKLTDPLNAKGYYKQTVTDVNGKYKFTYVENGGSVGVAAFSQDGKLEGYSNTINLSCNGDVELRPQVSAERIVIQSKDNISPFVIKITPESGADVSPNGLAVTYTFSEPIKQTLYTRTSKGPIGFETMMNHLVFSYDGLKKTASEIQATASWNNDFTQLTFTPAEVSGSAKYTINMTSVFFYFTDAAGNKIVNNPPLTGDFEDMKFTTNGGSAVPAAPVLARRTGLSYFALNYNGGAVGLEWNEDPNAAYYNIYQKTGSGPYELIAEKTTSRFYDAVIGALYAGTADAPQKSIQVSFKMTALSADLVEGPASNVITVGDEVKPMAAATGATLATGFTYRVQVNFSEPMNMASAQNAANYSFTNLGAGITYNITNIEYKESSTMCSAVITFTASGAIAIDSHLTVSNLKDLAGNTITAVQLF